MNETEIIEDLKSFPVIPAIRDVDKLDIAISKKSRCIFLLTGNILNIKNIVEHVKRAGKRIFLHIDLLEGISKDSMGIKYIAQEIKPDGVITTRANLVNCAKSEGLFTIQRIFVLDSLAVDTAEKSVKNVNPNAIEILPAVIPKVIGRVCQRVRHPVIAGGLIEDIDEVEAAIKEGAWAISVTKEDIWDYTF
ncbi:MAG: glycerol-3-phosphate responsive antiterminator [Tepidanaerobacter acetatoxydans]|uniref:glycerol-3-phosphate responsive antiterminator n=1 Tax=Tepidanaerobacter TaxID=499228 RepID=UPI000AAC55E3|nr:MULTISPECIES: glycerol-3-phosphate responsive antiterminator [Tepidanaerobacter]NLU11327.1 glycerol-3-phosphate responsive antiterminator [Tepidanaerobacter acetatoxydans]